MPSEADVPPGPRRRFVEEVFHLYRAARRPDLRALESEIKESDDLAGTASRETIRRMLRGSTVPAHWETVEAVLTVLCERAGEKPDNPRWEPDFNDAFPITYCGHLEALWNEALDNPSPDPPRPDPWLPLRDEPPF